MHIDIDIDRVNPRLTLNLATGAQPLEACGQDAVRGRAGRRLRARMADADGRLYRQREVRPRRGALPALPCLQQIMREGVGISG